MEMLPNNFRVAVDLRAMSDADRWWLRTACHTVTRPAAFLRVRGAVLDNVAIVLGWSTESVVATTDGAPTGDSALLLGWYGIVFTALTFSLVSATTTFAPATLANAWPSLSTTLVAALLLLVRTAASIVIEILVAVWRATDNRSRRATAEENADVDNNDDDDDDDDELLEVVRSIIPLPGLVVAMAPARPTVEIALPAATLGVLHYGLFYLGLGRPLSTWVGMEALPAAMLAHLVVYEMVPAACAWRVNRRALQRLFLRAVLCGLTGRWLLPVDSTWWFLVVASMPVLESAAHLRSVTVDVGVQQGGE